MKKIITILMILALFSSVLFAETNTVTVKSIVGRITIDDANTNASGTGTPLYQLFVIDGGNNATEYLSPVDISSADVVADFVIFQTQKIRTSGEQIDLTVNAEALKLNENSSDSPTLSNPVVNQDIGSSKLSVTGSPVGSQWKMTLSYNDILDGVPADTKIASFTGTWAKKAELAAHEGTYSANISLTYTTN